MKQQYAVNPYSPLDQSRNSDCRGRGQLLFSIIDAVSHQKPAVVNLVGPRWIGKTTALKCLVDHAWMNPEEYSRIGREISLDRIIFIYFDLTASNNRTRPFFELASELYEALIKHREINIARVMDKIGPDLRADQLDAEYVENRLSLLPEIANEQGWRFVICLDHIEKSNLLEDQVNVRRLELLASNASLVIATREPLKFVYTGLAASPLILLSKIKMLGLLSEAAAKDLLTLPEEEYPIRLTEEDISLLIQFVGRHPFLLIQAAQEAYEILLEAPSRGIVKNDIRARIEPSLRLIFEGFWQEYGDLLAQFFSFESPKSELEKEEQKAVRQKLQQATLIYENPDKEWDFKFCSPLFETFVYEKMKGEMPGLIPSAQPRYLTVTEASSTLGLRSGSNEELVLELLMSHAGEVLSKEQLGSEIWGDADIGRGLVTTISRLRSKLKEHPSIANGQIVSHRGKGYSFEWFNNPQ